MTNRELKQRIQTAFVNASPPSLPDDVIAACVPSEETEEPLRRPVALWRPMVAAAAVLALIVTGAALLLNQTPSVAMTVSLDVNPSITLEVDDHDAIVAVNTLNDDGSVVVGEQEWTGVSAETVVGILVDSMVQNGYLSENANSILISVDSADETHAAALEQKLATAAQSHLTAFEGAVLSQTLTADEALTQKAAQYGISLGKAMLIERIVELDPLKSFDDLANLSINDLNLICRTSQMPGVNASGNASDKSYIGRDAATDAALAHAGITAAQAVGLDVELDCEDGVMCYEVEFAYSGIEYEYEIDATTGAVRDCESDADDFDDDDRKEPTATKPTASNTTVATSCLSEQQVKTTVLMHAGVKEANVYGYECEFDVENGVAVYEIEFCVGDTEYEYRVDAVTGDVLFSEKETDTPARSTTVVPRTTTTVKQTEPTRTTVYTTTTVHTTQTTVKTQAVTTTTVPSASSRISEEQAKTIVLTHAGVAAEDVRGYKCKLKQKTAARSMRSNSVSGIWNTSTAWTL